MSRPILLLNVQASLGAFDGAAGQSMSRTAFSLCRAMPAIVAERQGSCDAQRKALKDRIRKDARSSDVYLSNSCEAVRRDRFQSFRCS